MNWRLGASISLEVLTSHRLRTLLSISGIVIGVAAVIMLQSAGLGARRAVTQKIEAMGSNLIIVTAGRTRVSGGRIVRASLSKTLKPADVQAIIKECPSVEMAAGSITRSVIVRNQGQTVKTTLIGLEPDGFVIRKLFLGQGRLYDDFDERTKRRVVVFASTARVNTFDRDDPVGRLVRLGKQPFRALGTTRAKGADLSGRDQDDKVFIPLSTALRRLVNIDYIDHIFIKARDGVPLSRAESEIRTVLRHRHASNQGDDFSIYNQLDLLRLQKGARRSLSLMLGSAAVLCWLIGGVGILAVMLISVRERRAEIGLRRAVGAAKADIFYQFLLEAGLIASLGGAVGVLIGLTGSWLPGWLGWWPATMSWFWVAVVFCLSVALGLICGLYPAVRAARLAPVEALRSA